MQYNKINAEDDYADNSKATIHQLLEVVKDDNIISKDKEASYEPFITNKYLNEKSIVLQENNRPIIYLCVINKKKIDFAEKQINILEQRIKYLIEILQEFAKNDDELFSNNSQIDDVRENISDKKNLSNKEDLSNKESLNDKENP
ncbi:22416_t:CDS:2, partial [Cetraspora pellucida]